MAWSNTEKEKLKQLFDEGKSYREIGEILGRSGRGVSAQAHKLGLSRKKEITEEQLQYLRDNYSTKTIRALAKDLGIAWETTKKHLDNLGLQAVDGVGPYWTEEDIQKLRELAKYCTAREIAEELNRTKDAVYVRANKLGIKIQGKRDWTKEDDEYLKEKWGCVKIDYIAKKLDRSIIAIKLRAKRMGLGKALHSGEDLALGEFCRESGISRDRIVRTLSKQNGFPLYSKNITSKTVKNYFVDLEKALKWMEENQSLFDATKVSKYLFPVEPEWLKQKRISDAKSKKKLYYEIHKTPWTDEELALAKMLIDQGRSYEEIAERLGRSVNATKSKLRESGYAYKLKQFWTGDEFKYLIDNWETKSDKEIAEHLGRSVKSVSYHREQLGLLRKRRKQK